MSTTFTKSKTNRTTAANPPVAKLRDGLLNLSIWERTTDEGTFHSVTFERRYTKKDGEWASTQSLGDDELLRLAELLRDAFKEIKRLRSSARESQ